MLKVNLCGTGLKGFTNIDISWNVYNTNFPSLWKAFIGFIGYPIIGKRVDLEKKKIPMKDNSVDVLICMNGIGYFTKKRAQFLIREVYRILKPGGVCRFGTQDLEMICDKYLQGHPDFQCDRINKWFNGYTANGKNCKYVYDASTLRGLFDKAGFSRIVRFDYQCSSYDIGEWDNREDQQLFIEGVK